MRICQALGGMTLQEMRQRMTGAEFALWIAHFELEASERKH